MNLWFPLNICITIVSILKCLSLVFGSLCRKLITFKLDKNWVDDWIYFDNVYQIWKNLYQIYKRFFGPSLSFTIQAKFIRHPAQWLVEYSCLLGHVLGYASLKLLRHWPSPCALSSIVGLLTTELASLMCPTFSSVEYVFCEQFAGHICSFFSLLELFNGHMNFSMEEVKNVRHSFVWHWWRAVTEECHSPTSNQAKLDMQELVLSSNLMIFIDEVPREVRCSTHYELWETLDRLHLGVIAENHIYDMVFCQAPIWCVIASDHPYVSSASQNHHSIKIYLTFI